MVILQKFCTENCQDAFTDIKFKEMPNVVLQPYWKPFHLQNNDFDDTYG